MSQWRGGLPERTAAKIPLLGAMLKAPSLPVTQAPEGPAAEGEGGPLAAGREVPFLRFGSEAKLQRLTQELEAKRADYETALRDVQRKQRELGAWEKQMSEERDTLKAAFTKEKEDLGQLKDQLARKETELNGRQVAIDQGEEANLKKTAEIYGKMSPERAAQILGEMYTSGQVETVVKILYLMQDRSAAKTLEAMTDTKVGAQITDKLRQVGKSVPQGA